MRLITLILLTVFAAEAPAKLWFWRRPPCEDLLRDEIVDMRVSEIYDREVFEDGLDTREHSDLDIRRHKNGRYSMRVGTSLMIDGDAGFTIIQEEMGIYIVSFKKKPLMKIEVSGDIAIAFHYDGGEWKKFARFTR